MCMSGCTRGLSGVMLQLPVMIPLDDCGSGKLFVFREPCHSAMAVGVGRGRGLASKGTCSSGDDIHTDSASSALALGS
jgi:hypothetical protein